MHIHDDGNQDADGSCLSRRAYVLVHGAYHGAWCWKAVAARLRALGHLVYTPTLTGLGERSHLMVCDPSLSVFTQDIAHVIRFEDLHHVVLVGHSFGGSVISGVADLMPERLSHLVYLDAQVLLSGESPASRAPVEVIADYRQRATSVNGILIVPPGNASSFGIAEPALMAWVQARLTPHTYRTYSDTLELVHQIGNGIPATYIACTEPVHLNTATSSQRARDLGWNYREILTGHDAMLTAPEELTLMLAGIEVQ